MLKTLLTATFVLTGTTAVMAAEPGPEDAADVARAAEIFRAVMKDECAEDAFFPDKLMSPDIAKISYDSIYEDAGAPKRHVTVFTYFCDRFAHAGSTAYVIKGHDGRFDMASFASPFTGPDPSAGGKWMDRPSILMGFNANHSVMNGYFDPETLILETSNRAGNDEYYASYKLIEGTFVFTGDNLWTVNTDGLVKAPRDEDGDLE